MYTDCCLPDLFVDCAALVLFHGIFFEYNLPISPGYSYLQTILPLSLKDPRALIRSRTPPDQNLDTKIMKINYFL